MSADDVNWVVIGWTGLVLVLMWAASKRSKRK